MFAGFTNRFAFQEGDNALRRKETGYEFTTNLLSKAADYDVNDLLYRNWAGDSYDINDQLHRIKAKTLIVQVKTDQWLRYAMAEESAEKIQGAKLIGFDHPLAHYAAFRALNVMKDAVQVFFKEGGMN